MYNIFSLVTSLVADKSIHSTTKATCWISNLHKQSKTSNAEAEILFHGNEKFQLEILIVVWLLQYTNFKRISLKACKILVKEPLALNTWLGFVCGSKCLLWIRLQAPHSPGSPVACEWWVSLIKDYYIIHMVPSVVHAVKCPVRCLYSYNLSKQRQCYVTIVQTVLLARNWQKIKIVWESHEAHSQFYTLWYTLTLIYPQLGTCINWCLVILQNPECQKTIIYKRVMGAIYWYKSWCTRGYTTTPV